MSSLAVAPLVLHDATTDAYFDAIWRGERQGFGLDHRTRALAENQRLLDDLNAKRITPASIVGRGVAKPLTTARAWLTDRIEQDKAALITHGRLCVLNRGNVASWMREDGHTDHPFLAHRLTFTTSTKYGHLWTASCGCGWTHTGYTLPRVLILTANRHR